MAGPLSERIIEQKRDEQGNLLYLTKTEIVDTEQYYDAQGNYIPATDLDEVLQTKTVEIETTQAYHTYEREVWSEEEQDYVVETDTAPNPPVMVDAGPLYEWREIVPTLDDKKQPKIDEINSLCAKEITSGIYSDADGIMRKYDSDVVDQLNFMQAMEMSKISSPIPYRVWTADGTEKEWIQLSYAQFCKVLSDGALIKAQLLMKCSELKKRINNATNEEELDLIKWSD